MGRAIAPRRTPTSARPSRARPARDVLIVIGSCAALLLAAAVVPSRAGVLVLACVNVVVLRTVWVRLAPLALSPPLMFAVFMSLMGIAGSLLANPLAGYAGTSGANSELSDELIQQTGALFVLASCAVALGGAFARGSSRKMPRLADALAMFDSGQIRRYTPAILTVASVSVIALYWNAGLDRIVERESYLFAQRSEFLGTVLGMASLAIVVALGVVFFGGTIGARIAATSLLVIVALYFLSLGTRRIALLPLLLVLSYVIAKQRAPRPLGLGIAGAASILGLTLPLTFRAQATHGVPSYFAAISSDSFSLDRMLGNLNNIIVGFRITALTSYERPPISIDAFFVSVSPLPGSVVGWPELSRELRLNTYTPYSSIGEIGNHGLVFAAIAFLLLGVVLGFIQRGMARLLEEPATSLVAIAIVGLMVFFTLLFVQYNLRSTTRYLYLALGVELVVSAWILVSGRRLERRTVQVSSRLRSRRSY